MEPCASSCCSSSTALTYKNTRDDTAEGDLQNVLMLIWVHTGKTIETSQCITTWNSMYLSVRQADRSPPACTLWSTAWDFISLKEYTDYLNFLKSRFNKACFLMFTYLNTLSGECLRLWTIKTLSLELPKHHLVDIRGMEGAQISIQALGTACPPKPFLLNPSY